MSTPPAKEQSRHQLNHELQDVISILTKLAKNNNRSVNDATGIITVAGTNRGAVLRMDGPKDTAQIPAETHNTDDEGTEAYANSNYQSINNSIVIGGSCVADDPGIHLHIEDYAKEAMEENKPADHHETKSNKKHEMQMSKRGNSADEDVQED
ncbi:hypothetical protein KSP40_PGU002190 [Platanthera guangdongensis]|uniref:Uncharacterized protein n=1 Tax=Platanthera guangdongensis TaxID=2320717 RepID=A0ABR2LE71_9ASPA